MLFQEDTEAGALDSVAARKYTVLSENAMSVVIVSVVASLRTTCYMTEYYLVCYCSIIYLG